MKSDGTLTRWGSRVAFIRNGNVCAPSTRYRPCRGASNGGDPSHDQRGMEIDLIKSEHREITPIEIKAARTFHSDFLRALETYEKLDDRIHPGVLIYAGETRQTYKGHELLPFTLTHEWFADA